MSEEKKAKNVRNDDTCDLGTVMVTGYAPGPRGTAVQHKYGYLGVIMEIDIETDIIVDVEFTFVTDLANNFFAKMIQGYPLSNGPEELYRRIRARCWTPSTEAIVACVKIAVQRYFDTKSTFGK